MDIQLVGEREGDGEGEEEGRGKGKRHEFECTSVLFTEEGSCTYLDLTRLGGHLVSLLTTNPEYVRAAGLDPNIIKGVMTISGVYTVGNPFSDMVQHFWNAMYRQMYVIRTFGANHADWLKYSPTSHIQQNTDHKLPPFCVFNASTDFGLEFDGKKFVGLLKGKNVDTVHHVIPRTHHGTVTRNELTADLCAKFLEDQLAKLPDEKKEEMKTTETTDTTETKEKTPEKTAEKEQ